MIDVRTLCLAGACALFAGVVLLEVHGGAMPNDPVIAAAPRVQPAPAPGKPASAGADTLVSSALNRPLFSQSRRPADSAPLARQSDLDDKRLAGIMVNEDRRVAIFAVNGSKSLMVGEGEEINGWRVEAITPLEVSLSGPDGIRTLQPKPDAHSRPISQSASNTRPPQATPPQPPSGAALGATADQTARRNRD